MALAHQHIALQDSRLQQADDLQFCGAPRAIGQLKPGPHTSQLERPAGGRLIQDGGNRRLAAPLGRNSLEQLPGRLIARESGERSVGGKGKATALDEPWPQAQHGRLLGGIEVCATGVIPAAGPQAGKRAIGQRPLRIVGEPETIPRAGIRRVDARRLGKRGNERPAPSRRGVFVRPGRGGEGEGRHRHDQKLRHGHDRRH